MSKDLPLIGGLQKPEREKTSSDIVYLGVDVAHGQKIDAFIKQLEQFKHLKPKAYFCDIVHTANQTGYALHLRTEIITRLKQRSPDITNKKHIVVRCNIAAARTFKARDKMYEIINEFRGKGAAKEVNFKSPDGRNQEIEY